MYFFTAEQKILLLPAGKAYVIGNLELFPFNAFLVSCYIPKAVEGGGAPPLPSKIAPRLGEQHETWL